MRIDILTLYPQIFAGYTEEGLLKTARQDHLVDLQIHSLYRWVQEPHQSLIAGRSKFGALLLAAAPVVAAVEELQQSSPLPTRVLLLAPRGRLLTQPVVQELAAAEHLILICGRFGGFERKLWQQLSMNEISVGEYILNGGEVASMVILDSLVRELPGVLEAVESRLDLTASPQ